MAERRKPEPAPLAPSAAALSGSGWAREAGWVASLHAVLGIVPLGVFLLYHVLAIGTSADPGQRAFERARPGASPLWTVALVFVPLLAHALLGVVRLRRGGASIPAEFTAPAMRRFQAVTGFVVLAFVFYHLEQVWVIDRGPHYSPRQVHAGLLQVVGLPLHLTIYALGTAALCFHFAHGVPRGLVTLGLLRDAPTFRRVRWVAGLAVGLVWLGYVNAIAALAIDDGLLPHSHPADPQRAPED